METYEDDVVSLVGHVEVDYLSQIGLNDTMVVSRRAPGRGASLPWGIVEVFVEEESSAPVPIPVVVRSDLAGFEAG